MTIRLSDIANPEIAPEFISVQASDDKLPGSFLDQYKGYLGIAHDSEDDNLADLLSTVLEEIGHPTALGINLFVQTWNLSVDLNGRRIVYLPRYNGVNVSTLDYDSDGNVIEGIEWEQVVQPLPIELYTTDADTLPVRTDFSYTVGFNPESYPKPVRRLVFMESAYRREFPHGVDDRGNDIVALPSAARRIRREWQPIYDLSLYFK